MIAVWVRKTALSAAGCTQTAIMGGTGSVGATDLLGRVGGVSDLERRITAILESSEP